jgi:acyl carrier protein
MRVTPSTLILAALSLVLARLSGNRDVVFGAAFSGRSTELRDSGNIVGPFANNVPIRAIVNSASPIDEYLKQVHESLLEINSHQFAPLADVQSWSEVPWRHRLFESIVVIQNYEVDEAARRLGNEVAIEAFSAPIHTNFPLLVLVEPLQNWRVTLIYDQREVNDSRAAQWGRDLVNTLALISKGSPVSVGEIREQMSSAVVQAAQKTHLRAQPLAYLAPKTDMENSIAKIWREMLQLERISVEERLFDLGAHSLLVTRLHQRLREALKIELSLVELFQYPTIRSLARHLDADDDDTSSVQIKNRGQQQREALARLRRPSTKK